jgi:hypothetical protein
MLPIGSRITRCSLPMCVWCCVTAADDDEPALLEPQAGQAAPTAHPPARCTLDLQDSSPDDRCVGMLPYYQCTWRAARR